jgi:hypothetical protein
VGIIGDAIDVIPPGRRDRPQGVGGMLVLEPSDICADLGIVPVPSKEFAHPGTGVAEQDFVNEIDGRCRALDVQEDGADLLQVDAVRSGK